MDKKIADYCYSHKIFCNLSGSATDSTFQTPAIVDRSPLMLAVSTGGSAPTLSRVIKNRLEAYLPSAYSEVAQFIESNTQRVAEKFTSRTERSRLWHRLLLDNISQLNHANGVQVLEEKLLAALDATTDEKDDAQKQSQIGQVALVGAGPGAPDLLTFRALNLIQQADAIVYDRLVSPEILDLCKPDAERIYAGKAKANHAIPQPEINELLANLAREGKHVVRLKGGDPFIFGRGGEEIETLAAQGINFQVVPGITAASGCAAFSGIPLTHRDHAQSCIFVTGHLKDGSINLNWRELTDPTQTIVVYMGLTGLESICTELINAGRSKETPIALIERGTTRHHQVHTGTLHTFAADIRKKSITAPTLLIIGSVVTLRQSLNWYD